MPKENGSRIQELSKGKQRELRKRKQKTAEKRKRLLINVGLATAGISTLGAVIAGAIYAQEEPSGQDLSHEEFEAPHILSEEFLRNTVRDSVIDVNGIFHTNLDPDSIDSRVIVVPRPSSLTLEEKQKWCMLFPCAEAASAVVTTSGEPIMYINTALLEEAQIAIGATTDQVREFFKAVSFNEIYHMITEGAEIDPSVELARIYDELVRRELSPEELSPEEPLNVKISGAKMVVELSSGKKVSSFQLLNEYYSTMFMNYMMGMIGKNDFFGKGYEERERYGILPQLFSELLEAMNNETDDFQKILNFQIAGKNEEFMRYVGSHFTDNPAEQLKKGFDILIAIETADAETFRKLIEKK